MLAKRMLHHPQPLNEVRPLAVLAEIEALKNSPELRRIFEGEAQGSASQLGHPSDQGAPEATGRQQAPERPPVAMRPPPRRRTQIAMALLPVLLAGAIAALELSGASSSFVADDPETARDGTASPTRTDGNSIMFMAATAGDVVERSASAEALTAATPDGADTTPFASAALPATGAELSPPSTKTAVDIIKASPKSAQAVEPAPRSSVNADAAPVAAGAKTAPTDAEMATNAPYPAPRESAEADPVPSEVEVAAEMALGLSRRDRREVQQRLRLAGHDPKIVDGIFGPDTRSAIAAWQGAAGLPATGFLDEPAMAMLVEQTDAEYGALQRAQRNGPRHEEEPNAVTASSTQAARPVATTVPAPEGCRRTDEGEIAFGRNMDCDAQGMRENFAKDLRDLRRDLGQLFR